MRGLLRGPWKVQGWWSERQAAREIPASKRVLAFFIGVYSKREKNQPDSLNRLIKILLLLFLF